MKDEQKKSSLQKYKIALQQGERFWPDSIFKDLLVSFGIFVLLILLATFVGVPGQPKVDPNDTTYIPRPEWYFLFLFKFLALWGQIPLVGKIEWIATTVVPGLAVLALLLLPFLDRNQSRHYSRRALSLAVMGVVVVDIVALTLIANIPTGSTSAAMATMTLVQTLAGLIVPLAGLLALFVLSFIFRENPGTSVRVLSWVGGATALGIIVLSGIVLVTTPAVKQVETAGPGNLLQQIAQGQDLYSINCTQCHGPDGEGGVIQGVLGLDGFKMKAIHSQDELYTRTDDTFAGIIAYGQPVLGMTPFGKAYGGALSPGEIDAIVAFMRYTWDDRAEKPSGAAGLGSIPALGPNEVPSYEVHIAALVKRYCISCHTQDKVNNNYLLSSYTELLNSGDNAPVVKAGDANSLLLQLITGHESVDPKTGNKIRQMPPTKLLDQQYIDMLTRWIMAGMPQTAADAAKLSPTSTPGAGVPGPTLAPTP
jgi:mono/diheme cytochrome c family protein